ncbi:orotidine-5'-phosphate decarboxylase [candidate division BRC1 bacterium HGW-BRC1-1]|nr:MAG: orotidine-5'-phosphate decarboxylase [candidate division BRC1 bacterium HGW-BRC1-1]
MTKSFNARLERLVIVRESHLCVGLDPVLNFADGELVARDSRDLKRWQTEMVIDAVAGVASVFKPNAAFFETMAGGTGWIPEKIRETDKHIITLCDAKRGDIGNTSEAYAESILVKQGYDAVTVNPLMGYDAVEPFLRHPDRGAFLLCLTSNPGADDFLLINDLYLYIAEKAAAWNRHGNVGLVVGATRPEQAARVREVAPELPLASTAASSSTHPAASCSQNARGMKPNRTPVNVWQPHCAMRLTQLWREVTTPLRDAHRGMVKGCVRRKGGSMAAALQIWVLTLDCASHARAFPGSRRYPLYKAGAWLQHSTDEPQGEWI